MKLVMVAVFSTTSTNNSQARGFEDNGVEVIRYNWRHRGRQIGNSKRDDEIIKLVRKEKPDYIFYSKGNGINIRVIKECNKMCKSILWYMDPVNTNFNEELIQKIKHCDYVFCNIYNSFKKAKQIGGDKVNFLQEGFDHLVNYPVNIEPKYDVSFIGGIRNERKKYYDNIKFHLFTHSFGKDHSLAVGESKINLNFTEGGTSDRTYKVLASKGFLLTQPYPNMDNDFIVGEDLDIFNNIVELKEKIKYYLNNEKERKRISENGFKKVQKFTRTNWAQNIKKIISDGKD